MTQIILLGILMTGSVFGAAIYEKRFEELLPVTCATIILTIYAAGIAGALKLGVYVVLVLSTILWIFSAYKVFKCKKIRSFLEHFLTPGFCVFVFLYFLLGFFCRDMIASQWDEFSHWADTVKAMVLVDDFGTNAAAHTMFPSYPPGMSVFQYFFQKVYLMLKPDQTFSEWRLFFAYQIFFLSFLMPFLKDLSFKKPLKIMGIAVLLYVGPMLIFTNVYSCIYIDAILGFVAGTAFAHVFLVRKKDWLYDIYVYISIAMLVLMKDAGMLFAAALLIVYLIEMIAPWNFKSIRAILTKDNIIRVVCGSCSLIIPKVLWSLNMRVNHVEPVFSGKVDIPELLRIILGRDPENYRSTVFRLYSIAMMTHTIELGKTSVEIPYIAVVIVLLAVSYVLCKKYAKTEPDKIAIRKTLFYVMLILSICFICGMCVSYMFKFSEAEAVSLAGFSRYLKIIFHFLWIFVLAVGISHEIIDENQNRWGVRLFCAVIVLAPWAMISMNVTRTTVDQAIADRSAYQIIADQVEKQSEGNQKEILVNVVCTEEVWCERLVLGYLLRPNQIKWNYKDEISAQEWQDELCEIVDYVALYKTDDLFIEKFSELFAEPDSIQDGKVYRVNKSSGLLESVE